MISDQLDRNIPIPRLPLRIVSCVPSITELLSLMNLENEVVGITKFCVHPDSWYENKQRIGGTKQLHLDTIKTLEPTLIIANKEENTKEDITMLSEHFPVYISDIARIEDCIEMVQGVGKLCAREQESIQIITKIQNARSLWKSQSHPPRKVAYLIWKDPYMAAGGDTYINEMLEEAQFINVFKNMNRYPSVSITEILESGAELILLSTEPFPFNQSHMEELNTHFANIKSTEQSLPQILIVDGEMFSWYGTRLIDAYRYFNELHKNITDD